MKKNSKYQKMIISNLKQTLILLFVVLILITLTLYLKTIDSIKFKTEQDRFARILINKPDFQSKYNLSSSNEYKTECLRLYKKLRFPNASLLFNPALKAPPPYMLNEFTMDGLMPIKKWWYLNDVYSDSTGAEADQSVENNRNRRIIKAQEINELMKRVRHNRRLNYGDKVLNSVLHWFSSRLVNKSMAVVGTQIPWIETIGLEIGCSKIVTLDYTRYLIVFLNLADKYIKN